LPEATYLIRGVEDLEALGRWLEQLIRYNGGRVDYSSITAEEVKIRGLIMREAVARAIVFAGPAVAGAGIDMHLVKHEEGALFHIAVMPYYVYSTYVEGQTFYDNQDSNYYWSVLINQIQTYYKLEPTTERITPAPPPTPPSPPGAPPQPVKCPYCGREATYIPQYGRYYCYNCRRYI